MTQLIPALAQSFVFFAGPSTPTDKGRFLDAWFSEVGLDDIEVGLVDVRRGEAFASVLDGLVEVLAMGVSESLLASLLASLTAGQRNRLVNVSFEQREETERVERKNLRSRSAESLT